MWASGSQQTWVAGISFRGLQTDFLEAVMVRMEGAWMEPDWPARRAATSPVTSNERHSHSPLHSTGLGSMVESNGSQRQRRLHMLPCARDVFQLGRADTAWCHCTTDTQGTGFIGFRWRDTTTTWILKLALLRASAGGC
jgi:hypothetical protein